LTGPAADFRLRGMSVDTPKQQFELELRKLESRINDLVDTCGQLKEENRSLRHRQEALIGERATLLQKNEQVRARVEGMITRLKAMETGA
jgi:cell division protein ZapB